MVDCLETAVAETASLEIRENRTASRSTHPPRPFSHNGKQAGADVEPKVPVPCAAEKEGQRGKFYPSLLGEAVRKLYPVARSIPFF